MLALCREGERRCLAAPGAGESHILAVPVPRAERQVFPHRRVAGFFQSRWEDDRNPRRGQDGAVMEYSGRTRSVGQWSTRILYSPQSSALTERPFLQLVIKPPGYGTCPIASPSESPFCNRANVSELR